MGSLSPEQLTLMPPEDHAQDNSLESTDDVFKGESGVTVTLADRLTPPLSEKVKTTEQNDLLAEVGVVELAFSPQMMNGNVNGHAEQVVVSENLVNSPSCELLVLEDVNGKIANGHALITADQQASFSKNLKTPVAEMVTDTPNHADTEPVIVPLKPVGLIEPLVASQTPTDFVEDPLISCVVSSVTNGHAALNPEQTYTITDSPLSPPDLLKGEIVNVAIEGAVVPESSLQAAVTEETTAVQSQMATEVATVVPRNFLELGIESCLTQKMYHEVDVPSALSSDSHTVTTTPEDSLEYFAGHATNGKPVDSPSDTVPSTSSLEILPGSTDSTGSSLQSPDEVFKEDEAGSKTDGDSGFYCQDCETAICSACTDIEHHSHLTTHLQDAVEEQKEVLQALLEKAEAQVPVLKEAIDLVADMEAVLASRSAEAEDQINTCFDSLRDVLEQRRHLLLAELDDTYSRKQQILSHQRELLDACLSDLSSSCEFTEKALNHGSDTEVLIVKKQMAERLSEFSAMQIQKMPEENDYLVYDESDFLLVKKSLYNLGSVQSNSAVAFETTAAGEGLKQSIVGKQTVVTITTKDRNGDLVKVGHSLFKAEITSLTSPVSYITEVSDHKNGSYDLVYTVPREGLYQLSIRLFGQHIKGSPFRVKAYVEEESSSSDRPISKIPRTTGVRQHATKRTPSAKSGGSNRRSNPIEDDLILRVGNKGRNKGEFTNPQGICCTTTGRIVVADSNNQCLQSFNNSGECKLRFGIRGRSAGQLQRPTGVAVMPTGNYVVADYDNKWVSVFEPNGKFVNRIGVGKLLGPKGVAVDKNGHIIVVDNKASCVLIFQANGKLISKFGSRGNQENQFAGPHFVAVNQKNQIVVSDFHNHCIKVFDSDGGFVMSFGSNGEGNGQFNAPTGVAVDAQDNILVADWGNSRIQVFDSNGSFLSYVNTMADPLYGPQGLALTESGHIVVADSGNHCYKVYKYLQ